MEGKVTMTELKTILTMDDLFEINALLDMEQDIKQNRQEALESSR
jgi:hypothetical protein